MPILTEGANTSLYGSTVTATLSGAVDFTALVVSDDGKVAGDADMIFFNQPTAPGVRLNGTTVHLDLSALRAGTDKVILVASPEETNATFAGLQVSLRMQHGAEAIDFTPTHLSTQTVAVLAELYRRAGTWKVRAIGNGYDNGLAGLATDFGVAGDVAVEDPAPPPASVNLAKKPLGVVELTKKGSAVIPLDFSKPQQASSTVFRIDLEWDGGSAQRRSLGADLDLYALWADKNGRTGAVYYRDLGSLTRAPYVQLEGDSQTPGRETVRITRPDQLAHVLICAYSAVENGPGSFKSYGAKAIIDDAAGSRVTVPLFNTSEKYWVVIAQLTFTFEGVCVQQVENYGRYTTEARPLLHADGTFEMGAGPVEFKYQ